MNRHALCQTCTIFLTCTKPAETVPNDSTKACFFSNPAISRPHERCANCVMDSNCDLPRVNGFPKLHHCFVPRKEADMAAQDPKDPANTPKLTDAGVKALMSFRAADSCASCKHCTVHPGSGHGGESYETFQCVANAIHPFKLPTQGSTSFVCDFFCTRDELRGKRGSAGKVG